MPKHLGDHLTTPLELLLDSVSPNGGLLGFGEVVVRLEGVLPEGSHFTAVPRCASNTMHRCHELLMCPSYITYFGFGPDISIVIEVVKIISKRDTQKSLLHRSLGPVIHGTLGTWTTGRSLWLRIPMERSGPGLIFIDHLLS